MSVNKFFDRVNKKFAGVNKLFIFGVNKRPFLGKCAITPYVVITTHVFS